MFSLLDTDTFLDCLLAMSYANKSLRFDVLSAWKTNPLLLDNQARPRILLVTLTCYEILIIDSSSTLNKKNQKLIKKLIKTPILIVDN
jgi:hypothetical protein